MKTEDKNKLLTDEEKIALVSGKDFMYTNPVSRLGIKSISMSDGPHGLRKQAEEYDNGITVSEPATAFPTAAATASSFNEENLRLLGVAIAEECLHYGVDIILGPGTNIKRNPLCGRNFEYFSEDPYLAGKVSSAMINGVQSKGVGVAIKHFALNNSENYRLMGNSIADMRAIREIYLKPFEIAVKEAKPDTVMCAYNKINGTYCSENKWLLSDVLRDEWGFEGAVMTDWGAMHNRVNAIKAGLDIEMPGDTTYCRRQLFDAKEDPEVKKSLDASAERVVKLAEKYSQNKRRNADFEAHNALAARIAEDSAVLLKNDGTLPLSKQENVLVIGELFSKMRYQGAGSSLINAIKVTSPKDAFDSLNINYKYVKGYEENKVCHNEELVNEAKEEAKNYEKILVFMGLTDYVESEGCDRENMRLPENQLKLIEELCKLGKKIAVVLFGGSPFELPFEKNVNAILNMYLPGQNGGTATANLLFGEVNPSGKLAETWLKSYDCVPFGDLYSKEEREIYKEGIYVGYRYHTSYPENILYPFGYGLSYTEFEYKNLELEENEECIKATFDLSNIGTRFGKEVAELYISKKSSNIARPKRELKAFVKVSLNPSETKRVSMEIKKSDLAVFDIEENKWIVEDGEYTVEIAKNSLNVNLSSQIYVNCKQIKENSRLSKYPSAEDILSLTNEEFEKFSGMKIPEKTPPLPLTLESRFTNFKLTFFGKIIYKAVLSMSTKSLKKAKKLPEGTEKENRIKGAVFLGHMLNSNSANSMAMCAGKTISYNITEGLVELANGHIFKALKCFLTKIKAPDLPN